MRIELMLIKQGLPQNGLNKITDQFTKLMQRHYANEEFALVMMFQYMGDLKPLSVILLNC